MSHTIEAQDKQGARTRISMTNIIVINCDKGVPRVSTVMLPGQSQISSGMTVLDDS